MNFNAQLSISSAEVDPNDSDYEDLPPITSDTEDGTIDTPDNSNQKIHAYSIPFMRIYDPPKDFNDPRNEWLIPNCALFVKIIDVQRDGASHLLNPYVYTIEVRHSTFTWNVMRRHNHFHHLHQQLLLYRTALKIPIPTRKHRERRKSISRAHRRPLPRFPRKPDALISQESLPKRAKQLEDYLQNCLHIPMYRKHHEMMSFLDISPLSFVEELGQKGKESLVKKRAGGFRRATFCKRFTNCFTDLTGHWRKRWLLVKDSCLIYMRPKDGKIRAVMLFDQGLQTSFGAAQLGVHHGILISNLTRELMLKCWTSRNAQELSEYIIETHQTLARDFTQSNRFNSFAPERSSMICQWYIDGANYFEAIADILEYAKEEIFIADWMLSPEIFMHRPVMNGDKSRLDKILQRKASQGIRVYVLLYKEVEFAMGINSLYSKQTLLKLHPNIHVLRHPDTVHGGPLLWSHHEKIVIVDQTYAFVGGIDLCYGRWDNHDHRVADLGGVSVEGSGDTTDNARLSMIRNSASPAGVKVRSVSQSQVSLKRDSDFEDLNEKPGILIGSTLINNNNDAQAVRFDLSSIDKSDEINKENGDTETDATKGKNADDDGDDAARNRASSIKKRLFANKRMIQAVARLQTLRRQISRKRADTLDATIQEESVGIDDGDDMDAAPLRYRKTASEVVLTDMGLQGGSKWWYGKDYVNFIVRDLVNLNQPLHDLIDRNTTPRMPWHDVGCFVAGSSARDVARHFIQRWNYIKLTKAKYHPRYPWLLPKSHANCDASVSLPKNFLRYHRVSCQTVRSSSSWSCGTKNTETSIHDAYCHIIRESKHYIYIENQFFITNCGSDNGTVNDVINTIGKAIYERIVRAHENDETFRAYVLFPLLPAFEGEIGTTRGAAIQAVTHYDYATICRGGNSLLERLQKKIGDTSRYITFYGLRNYGELHGRMATELVYVHSKLLIADDRIAIIGSANINDRSMLGYRDSEVAMVITDEEFEKSVMNNESYNSGKFCGSLRRSLMQEHLGLVNYNNEPKFDVRDPVSDHFYKDVWIGTAARNSSIYEKVFPVVPTDEVRTFAQLRDYLSRPKLAQTDPDEAKHALTKIKGHIVLTPLYFLCDENLTPAAGTKESLFPVSLWT